MPLGILVGSPRAFASHDFDEQDDRLLTRAARKSFRAATVKERSFPTIESSGTVHETFVRPMRAFRA